ncbi:hypothetical protein ACA910_011541 [Epithemia clementina (nom. ined.)]
MSRFWAGANSSDSDSDQDSDSDNDSSSMDSSNDGGGAGGAGGTGTGGGGGGAGGNRWLAMSDSESSGDDEQRVVKSGQERALESFQWYIRQLRQAMRDRDYYAIQTEFEKLAKAMIKAKQYLRQGIPRPLVKMLVQLEDYNAERLKDKEQFKKLSARQGRALNKMKLILKKHNKAYQVVMNAYRENPDDDDVDNEEEEEESPKKSRGDDDDDDDDDDDSDSDSSSSSSSSDSDSSEKKKKKTTTTTTTTTTAKKKNAAASSPAKKKAEPKDSDEDDDDAEDSDEDDDDKDDDDDDSDDWASSSSSSDSDDDDEGVSQLKGRARWLKKNTPTKEKVPKDKETKARERKEQREKQAAQKERDAQVATKSIVPTEHLTPSVLQRKVRELALLQRGRAVKGGGGAGTAAMLGSKQDARRVVLNELQGLYRLAVPFGPRIEVPILMHVISAQFNLQRTLDDYMDTAVWKTCAMYLQRMATLLVDEEYTLVPAEDIMATGTAMTTTTDSALATVVEGSSSAAATSGKVSDPKMAAAAAAEGGAMAAVAADEPLVNPHTGQTETPDERAERLRLEHDATLTDAEKKNIPVVGSLSLHLTRLEEEYVKSLQKVSHHSTEYVSRLRDESLWLVPLLARFQAYYERLQDYATAATLAQLRLEHLYYRHDSIATQVDKAALFTQQFGQVQQLHPACVIMDDDEEASKPVHKPGAKPDYTKVHPGCVLGKPEVDESAVTTEFAPLLSELCSFVYKHGTEASKTRAMICQICHWASHNRFVDARDLLLMSHLQDTIYSCNDITIMVLYNRMMVNLGLCAFRLGRIHEAHQCLSELCSGRIRELLAQGFNASRFNNEKSAEQEKAEKRRQVPYHQHINLDLLEACHLISAMLLEVPNMAATAAAALEGNDGNRRGPRVVSRTFRKFHDQYNHQVFTGPPEQTRDYVMRASKALMKGDWKTCADLVTTLPVWKLVPGDHAEEEIAKMLTDKIKVEGLRTYLLAFTAQAYDSLSLPQLCGMFDLTPTAVHSVVSKMMIQRELYASWDQPTQTIVLLRKVVAEPTPLQVLALQYAEKAALLVESNERLLDAQMGVNSGGGGGGRDNRDGGGYGDHDDNNQDNKRRHHHHHRDNQHWNKDDNNNNRGDRGDRGGGDRGDRGGWHNNNNRERGGRGRGGGRGGYRNNRDRSDGGGGGGDDHHHHHHHHGGGGRGRGGGGRGYHRGGGGGGDRQSSGGSYQTNDRQRHGGGRGGGGGGGGRRSNNNSGMMQ